MKKIMSAVLDTTNTENEYQWIESTEEECGREWNGDVKGFVENLDIEDDEKIITADDYEGAAIHNLPYGAVILTVDGVPHSIYWSEEVEADEE